MRLASELRIPVAPVHGADEHPRLRPLRRPRRLRRRPDRDVQDAATPVAHGRRGPAAPATRAAPGRAHRDASRRTRRSRPAVTADDPELPLAGVRVLDLTAWWAGPIAAGMLAALGADVIHVESVSRIDGMRATGAQHRHGRRRGGNAARTTCARTPTSASLTLDLGTDDGLALLRRLIAESDAVLENFSPRVLGNFGLEWEQIHAINPQCLLVRMPAFGLSGPWRDNVGFAQTMEQVTGLAWITGHRDDQPRIQQGPSDPNAGMHAAFALIVGSRRARRHRASGACSRSRWSRARSTPRPSSCSRRRRTATCSSATATAARTSRRKGLYPGRDDETWLAISVATDDAVAGSGRGARVSGVGRRSRAGDRRRPARPARRARRAPRRRGARRRTSPRRRSCSSRTACRPPSDATRASMYDHPQLQARAVLRGDRPPRRRDGADPDAAVPLRVGRPLAAHAGTDAGPAQPRDPRRRPGRRRVTGTPSSRMPRSSGTARRACEPGMESAMTATLDDQVRLMESNWFMSYPHDVYARLRREAPVYWSPRDEVWAISKYEDIRWISKHPELFSNRYHIYVAGANVDDNGQEITDDTGLPRSAELRRIAALGPMHVDNLVMADGDRHRFLRKIAGLRLHAQGDQRDRGQVQRIAMELFDEIPDRRRARLRRHGRRAAPDDHDRVDARRPARATSTTSAGGPTPSSRCRRTRCRSRTARTT